jgi:hypothetical protein
MANAQTPPLLGGGMLLVMMNSAGFAITPVKTVFCYSEVGDAPDVWQFLSACVFPTAFQNGGAFSYRKKCQH